MCKAQKAEPRSYNGSEIKPLKDLKGDNNLQKGEIKIKGINA